jgi:hypothetical protein
MAGILSAQAWLFKEALENPSHGQWSDVVARLSMGQSCKNRDFPELPEYLLARGYCAAPSRNRETLIKPPISGDTCLIFANETSLSHF